MIGTARILFVVLIVFLFTVPLLPVQYLSVRFERFFHKSLPRFWHRVIAKLLGLRVHVTGSLVDDRPLLIVANHSSWADIIVLSTVAEVSFIAKSEVRNWPLFGMFAVLQRSVFVERERKHRSGQQANTIAERLAKGDAMVLFAEGTTSDGNRVLPFKSSLFGAAQLALRDTDTHRVLVQPVSIAYTKVHGLPLGRYMRPSPTGRVLLRFSRASTRCCGRVRWMLRSASASRLNSRQNLVAKPLLATWRQKFES